MFCITERWNNEMSWGTTAIAARKLSCVIARSVQDTEGDRNSQNDVTGAYAPLPPQVQSPGQHAAGHQPEAEVMQHTDAFDVHQAVAMGGFFDLEQPPETPSLASTGRERLDHPDIGEDIHQLP